MGRDTPESPQQQPPPTHPDTHPPSKPHLTLDKTKLHDEDPLEEFEISYHRKNPMYTQVCLTKVTEIIEMTGLQQLAIC